jgi:hypothetical protein
MIKSGYQGEVGGRHKEAENRYFLDSENTLYETIMADTHHYAIAQTHKMYRNSES